MKIAIITLGCKVNQYETQAMERELRRRGHHLVNFPEPADAYIINTCTVTAVSDRKSRNLIRRARKLSPDAVVGVCGCYAQTDPQAVAQLEVDVISGSAGRMAFLDFMEEAAQHKKSQVIQVDNAFARRFFEPLEAGGMEGRTRAMLKVEDGCVNFCTYCIIPYARGPVRSLPMLQAITQAKALEAAGYREIVLTGIEISSWGQDFKDGSSLIDLIEAICEAVPSLRIRLGSLEPRTIDEDFCRRTARMANLCPHFHLSLQSGCDATLERMKRKYSTSRYLQSVELLRQWFANPAITTDLIVGFPGETEEEFCKTLDFLRNCHFSAVHIFPYSVRPNTPAAEMDNQIPKQVKEERACRAAQTAEMLRQEYLAGLLNTTLPILFEEEKDGFWQGHAPNYIPVLSKGENLHNKLRNVHITGIRGNALLGDIID